MLVIPIVVVNVAQYISNTVRSDESHNSVIRSIYVGDCQDVHNSANLIPILPSGSASFRLVLGIMHYTISGGRATFGKETKRLAIKFSFFGPSWHVDEPPHQTSEGSVMKLDGQIFRKFRTYPSPSMSGRSGARSSN
jgi:hypothetical protein